jgi:uncharacterized protein YigE (DUF2233 family)
MKAVWKVARAAVAAAALALGGGAQAGVVYDVNFDPIGFFGNGQLQIDPSCLSEDGTFSSDSENCPIDVLFMNAHDSGGGNWDVLEVDNIATSFVVHNGQLVAIDGSVILDFSNFDPDNFSSRNVAQGVGCEASGQLTFLIPDNVVTFDGCNGLETGIYRIPEPASIGLTLAGLGAALLARRRRKQS